MAVNLEELLLNVGEYPRSGIL